MVKVALSYLIVAALVGAGAPALAAAQSSTAIKPRPATVVRYGGTRAGIAPPPASDREGAHSRTTEGRGGFEGEGGVGVVVGSFGRPIGRRGRRVECSSFNSGVASAAPVQPHASQPVVTQPGFGSAAPDQGSASESRVCGRRRAP